MAVVDGLGRGVQISCMILIFFIMPDLSRKSSVDSEIHPVFLSKISAVLKDISHPLSLIPFHYFCLILAVPAGWWRKVCGDHRNGETGGIVPTAADGGQNSCTGQDCHLPEGNHTTTVWVFNVILLFIFRK